MLKKTNEQDSLTNGDKRMNKKRLEEIVKQEKSKVLSEAKIGPNDKFYIATKTFTADTGRITKGELYISTGKPTKVKVQGDDGPFWSTEINVEMANPNYEAFEGIDPNGFNKLFKEVDPNKDLKAMKYLSKWGLVEHGDTYYVGSWSPGRETSLEHAKTMLSKLKKVSSESPNQAVLKIAGYKGSMIDIARGITVVRKWADMYEIVFDDKTKSISPQKLVNLLKKGGYTRHGKQVQLLKAGMNEASIKKKKGVELTYGQAISTKDIDKSIEKHIEKNYPKDHNPGVSRFHGGGKVGMTGKQGHGLKPANIMAIQKFAKKNNDKKLLGLIDEWIKVAKANDIIEGKVNEGKYNVGDKFTTTQYGKTTNWWIDKIKGTSIQLDNDHPTFSKFGLHIQDFDTQVKKKKFIPVNESIKIVESVNEDLPTKEIDPKEFPNPLPSSKKGFLKKGDPKNDGGKADDDVVPTKDVQIAVSKLKPSQDAIYLGKSLAMAINGVEGGDLGAVISKDNYILDGHHRYAATSFNNPNASVGGVRANLNIGDLIPVLRAVGDAMKNKRGVEPKGGDVNIFKATMDDIKNVIYKGKNVPAQYYDKEKSIAWFEAIGEDVLSKRLKQLQSKRPPAGAPMRKDMPKIRPGQINLLKALLNKGKIDVREPYAENVNEVNWSSLHNDNKKQSLLDAIKIVKNNKVGSERKKAMNYILARAKEASNGTSPRTYKQALQMLDMSESVNNETINRIINEEVDKFVSGLTEGKWTKIMKNARELNVGGTWTVIANDTNKRKVVGQYPTKIMAMIPALYEKAKKEHPGAKITVENGEGKSFVAESVNENGIMYKAGVKKYGKEGMTKIQSAAGKDLGHEEIGKIKDKYEKGKKGKNEAIEEDLGSVGGMSIPTIVSSLFALYVMFKIAYTTNADVQELKKLGKAILMRVPILGPKLAKKDFVKGLDTIFKTADMSKIESYLTKNPKLSKIIGQIKGGDTYAWKKLYGELKDMDYKAYGQSQKIISKFYQSLKPSKKK